MNSYLDYSTHVFLLELWLLILLFSISAVPISFYYRFRVLCQGRGFPISLQMKCLFVVALISVTYGIQCYYAIYYRTKSFLHLGESLAPWFADKDGKVKAIAILGTVSCFIKSTFCFSRRDFIVTKICKI